MEDIENNIFVKRDEFLLYKSIMDQYTLDNLKTELVSMNNHYSSTFGSLAFRDKLDESYISSELLNDIKKCIMVTLSGYFYYIQINNIRFYKQTYGNTKPHYDSALDGVSNYTLLIYLTDDFEGGELVLKCKMTEEEMNANEYKKYIQYTFKPKIGYGILFDKRIFHWANEVYGTKSIMLVDILIKN